MTKIICLEGITGSGKTTQTEKISEYFRSANKSHLVINEKQYNPFKQIVIDWHNEGANQNFLYETIVKFAKARAEVHKKHFIPLISKIDYLLFDRSLYTSGVYQTGEEISSEEIIEINLKEGVLKPEEGLVLLCSPKIALERTNERRKEKNHYNLPSMHETLNEIRKRRKLYLQLLAKHFELYLIDAEKSKEEIFEELKEKLKL